MDKGWISDTRRIVERQKSLVSLFGVGNVLSQSQITEKLRSAGFCGKGILGNLSSRMIRREALYVADASGDTKIYAFEKVRDVSGKVAYKLSECFVGRYGDKYFY